MYQSLLELSQLASDVNDPQLGDYLDGYLKEQARRRAQPPPPPLLRAPYHRSPRAH